MFSLVSQACVSSLEHQSDAPEAPFSCLDQEPVSRADFPGKRVLELWPLLSRSGGVCDAFGACTSSDGSATIRQQLHSLRPLIQSSEQSRTIQTKLLEILTEETIRTLRADVGEEASETVTEHEDSHHGAAPRHGAVSSRRRVRLRQFVEHLMSCSSSATPAFPLEHRALCTVATRKI